MPMLVEGDIVVKFPPQERATLMRWQDLEDIAIELYDSNPNLDPLTVRFYIYWTWYWGIESSRVIEKR